MPTSSPGANRANLERLRQRPPSPPVWKSPSTGELLQKTVGSSEPLQFSARSDSSGWQGTASLAAIGPYSNQHQFQHSLNHPSRCANQASSLFLNLRFSPPSATQQNQAETRQHAVMHDSLFLVARHMHHL